MGVTADYCIWAYPIPKNIETKLAIDIGANIGGFSMAYNNVFDEIIFYEANTPTFKKAIENTKKFTNVKGYNLAVMDKSDLDVKLMNHYSNDDGSVSCSPTITENNNPDWNGVIGYIKTISLEDILKSIGNRRINFLKMDCENSEYEILLNKDLSRIDHISMELHCQMGETKHKELVTYLTSLFHIEGDIKYYKNKNSMIYLTKK